MAQYINGIQPLLMCRPWEGLWSRRQEEEEEERASLLSSVTNFCLCSLTALQLFGYRQWTWLDKTQQEDSLLLGDQTASYYSVSLRKKTYLWHLCLSEGGAQGQVSTVWDSSNCFQPSFWNPTNWKIEVWNEDWADILQNIDTIDLNLNSMGADQDF